MLKGFNYPLTPKGKSSLNPPPPWHYSSDFLNIEFWANTSATAALLPPGLELDRYASGHANALFYDWQFSGNDDEYLDPGRYQYREFFILVDALYEGKPVAYCPYIFVDTTRHWLVVDPGLSEAAWPAFSDQISRCGRKGGSSLAAGSKFSGSLTSAGQRIAEAVVTPMELVTDTSLIKQKPVINLLHCRRLATDKQDKPAVHELVESVPKDVKIEQMWIAEGALTLSVCEAEELSDLAPVRCGKGIRASMAYVVEDLKTLKDLRRS